MSCTVSQIIVAARRNTELLTSETAAYMVLSLAEQSLAAPRRVCPEHVFLHQGGGVTIGEVDMCSSEECAARLRALLRDLLTCSVPATVSEALVQVAEGGRPAPEAVRSQLQTALVPINRGAARRALARLHRKLENAELPENVAAEAVGMTAAAVSRRTKRRAPPTVDEIPVAVDETAFRVLSRLGPTADQSRSDERGSSQADEPAAAWDQVHATPAQFRERLVSGAEGTPILGTVLVRERDDCQNPSVLPATEAVPRAADSLADSTPGAPWSVESRETWESTDLELAQWGDTFVDARVASVGDATEAAPTFNPRRSRVSDLVERMPVGASNIEQARQSLLEMVNGPNEEHDFLGLGTVTPPPVAQDTRVEPSRPPRRVPRRIVLSSLAAGAAGLCAWAMLGPLNRVAPSTTVAAPPSCAVTVHVEVPSAAQVFLNDALERQAQNGPIAKFNAVACGGQAELTVQVPSPEGSPLPAAWVRMPLPETELRSAFESGRPLVVAPLGDHK